MDMQQMQKTRDVNGKSKKNVHFLPGKLQSSSRYTMIMTEVARLGKMKVVPKITQSSACLLVITCQHIFSLSVVLMLMMTSRKMPRMRDGMQVNIMFLKTKLTILKYLPGARASRQMRRVMKMIQKLAATLKDTRPMMLIMQSMLFELSMYPSTSEAEKRISLTRRMVRTCIMGIELCLHLSPKRVTKVIRKSITPTEHQALTSQTSKLISEFLYIIIVTYPQLVRKYQESHLRVSAAQPGQVNTQLTALAHITVGLQFELQQFSLLYSLDKVGLEFLIVLLRSFDLQLFYLGER